MGKIVKAVGIGILLIGVSFLIPGSGFVLFGATITSGSILMAGVASVLAGIATVAFAPKVPPTQISRLNVTLDPSTPRKAVLGTTAMCVDMRYHETSGSTQEYIDYIIAVAAHKVTSIDEIWLEEKLAWSATGGVQSTYTGYLTVAVRTEGTAANYISINGGVKWGSTRRLTGCAYVHMRIKRTGATSTVESPLVGGLPSRITIIGNGALLYDPRKDSTVAGGSGAHRANNQSTWGSYTDPDDCDNSALQLLWWLLGWKINDKLSIGCGIPPERIDLESFITAANICDESVSLSIGGTQKRYRSSGTASDSDNRMEVMNTLLTCMNGTLRDSNGKLTLTVLKNDLADWVLDFNDHDVLGEFKWDQTRGMDTGFNIVRGRYIDPSQNSLYQLVEYPEISITSLDGIERVMTLDLPYVEDGRRAQRIAKQSLQRNQYRGMFSAVFTAKALGCSVGDIVRLSFIPLGWSDKPFRVISQQIGFDGKVPLVLIEENAAIYAWDNDDSAPVTPTAPTIYNPLNNPFIIGTNLAGESANWSGIIDDNGFLPENDADVTSMIVAEASTTIQCLSNGTPKDGQVNPRYVEFKLSRNGVDFTESATWSVTVLSGTSTVTISNTAGSRGRLNITANSTDSIIRVTAVYDGKTRIFEHKIVRLLDISTGTTPTGGTTANGSISASVSSTTMVAIGTEIEVTVGSGGSVNLTADYTYSMYSYLTLTGVYTRWYEWNGSSWVAIGTEVAETYIYPTGGYPYLSGYGSNSYTRTGLTASSTKKFKLYGRGTDTYTRAFSGTCSATGV